MRGRLRCLRPEWDMRMRVNRIIILFALFASLGIAPLHASPGKRPTPEHISQLIARLGSSKVKEREDAAATLNAIGEPALAALREATRSRDPEVCRRAEILANDIHKRVQTARLLAPKRVHLVFENTPITE